MKTISQEPQNLETQSLAPIFFKHSWRSLRNYLRSFSFHLNVLNTTNSLIWQFPYQLNDKVYKIKTFYKQIFGSKRVIYRRCPSGHPRRCLSKVSFEQMCFTFRTFIWFLAGTYRLSGRYKGGGG